MRALLAGKPMILIPIVAAEEADFDADRGRLVHRTSGAAAAAVGRRIVSSRVVVRAAFPAPGNRRFLEFLPGLNAVFQGS